MAGYVETKKGGRLWYQLRSDLVLYKFKAHEVGEGGGEGGGKGGRSSSDKISFCFFLVDSVHCLYMDG